MNPFAEQTGAKWDSPRELKNAGAVLSELTRLDFASAPSQLTNVIFIIPIADKSESASDKKARRWRWSS